ncbi:MAG: M23 family metallopeptidase [Patescibacteria group bacterium]
MSRVFRHIFEHKNIKKILGSNIALAIVATSVVPATTTAASLPNSTPIIIKQAQGPLVTNIEGTRLPVKILKLTQRYWFAHQGVDLDGETGDAVTPIKDGAVISVIYSRVSYGNHVIIDHGNGATSLYAHLSKVFVKEGDHVTVDQTIGLMGSTGRSTGSHLHLEVRQNGKTIDPLKVIPQN